MSKPIDVVLAFVAELAVFLRALRATTTEISRADLWAPLTARDSSGSRSRMGEIPGVGSFKLHGVGCRVELDSGAEIDFDWDREGRATFDRWRVRDFARSLGLDSFQDSELDDALMELCATGVLTQAHPGKFHVQERLVTPPTASDDA